MRYLDPVPVVDLFPELRERLLALLTGLTDAQWDAPTVCAGWSVKDVALHLLGGTAANVSRRRDGFGANFLTYVPEGGSLDDEATFVTTINGWNEGWVVAARRLSPRLLCELLDVTMRDLADYFRTVDLLAMGDPVSWAGPEPAPVWLDVAREYTEHWTHQAQIRDAVGAPLLDEPRLFAPVLATFMHALPHTLRDLARPEGTRLRVVVTGPAGGAWDAVRAGTGWDLARPVDEPAGTRVTLDQDTAWRLVTKGMTAREARAHARIDGDESLAAAVLEMVAIIA
jgi:uncharacterized protein (TIGR03083 family)